MKNYFESKVSGLNLSQEDKRQINSIMATSIGYVPNSKFLQPALMAKIMEEEVVTGPDDRMSREQEETLFLQMNYLRYKLEMLRRLFLRKAKWNRQQVLELIAYEKRQREIRDILVTSNIGLAIAMAHRIHLAGLDYEDMVSEGSIALLKVADRFDCSYGFRFSTYACRAILRRMSRLAKKHYRVQGLFPVLWEPSIERDTHIQDQRQEYLGEKARSVSEIVLDNKAGLTETELSILRKRFSLGKERFEPMTLKSIGQELDLSKERIRQIQKAALNKVRQVSQQDLITA